MYYNENGMSLYFKRFEEVYFEKWYIERIDIEIHLLIWDVLTPYRPRIDIC